MLISHRYNFIYTKTVKTAGTSVEAYFEKYCLDDSQADQVGGEFRSESVSEAGIIGARNAGAKQRNEWWNHMPAAMIKNKLGVESWGAYFKFCCIRNPFDKAMSAFSWLRHIGEIATDANMDDQAQFEHWLLNTGPPIDRNKYLIDGKFCLDDVIRYESLRDDVARIGARLGLPAEPERLQAFKSGVRRDTMSADRFYSPRSIQFMRKTYAFEFNYFGYRFPANTASTPAVAG